MSASEEAKRLNQVQAPGGHGGATAGGGIAPEVRRVTRYDESSVLAIRYDLAA